MKQTILNLAVAALLSVGAVVLVAEPAAAQILVCWWGEVCTVTPSGSSCSGGWVCVWI